MVLDEAGNPAKTIAIARDVTRRKRAEDALRESERAYRDLFELSPDGIVAWDRDGVIQTANVPAAKLLGYDNPDDMIGKHWLDFIAPEERPALIEQVRRPRRRGHGGSRVPDVAEGREPHFPPIPAARGSR